MKDKKTKKSAVIVFSGGQDSTTCLINALKNYDVIHCITFHYNQKHSQEVKIAIKISKKLNIFFHKIINLSVLDTLTESCLINNNLKIPCHSSTNKKKPPKTFVPGRNILFLTLASIYAYKNKINTVISGVCETDFSGYPDCRNKFIKTLNTAIILGLDKKILFKTPLMFLKKSEIWALSDTLGKLDFIKNKTLSCYNGIKSFGCGNCSACYLRNQGLLDYQNNKEKVINNLLEKKKKYKID
ncbi:7-cyano-7-deazaguanine synthase QueC [Candidatus Tachikawaea gelatinosa]|uniref:7-cyano-7-deazaguanine synthase n=1 Tax=Candidatus Tachikawaea gelatinosa TaxID=1410383 RepID=A0A090BWM7_9ENTR|nr:7-cyano-7-deazaguanine synthase QueC [Candidatus Tachikawaea gelatinosa]BAP58876.1 7-cyano-7-deazaguanine synthase [Candidatus Tachikawaea gelatinosa]